MKRVFLVFAFLLQAGFSQNVEVFLNATNSKYSQFERELIESVISIYKQRTRSNWKVNYYQIENFKDILSLVKQTRENSLRMGINSISITEDRKDSLSFSVPYFNNKYCLLTDSARGIGGKRVGILVSSSHALSIKDFPTYYSYHLFESYSERLAALKSNKIDYIISDFIDQWTYGLKLVDALPTLRPDQYGLIFPKHEHRFDRFKEVFKQYISSLSYERLVEKHFGKDGLKLIPKNKKSRVKHQGI